MSQISPFTPILPQTARAQREQAERVRRAQSLARGGDAEEEHQVETADAIVSIHEETQQHPHQEKREQPPRQPTGEPDAEDSEPRLDIKA